MAIQEAINEDMVADMISMVKMISKRASKAQQWKKNQDVRRENENTEIVKTKQCREE